MKTRFATLHRQTAETTVTATVQLDGTGEADVHTGVPFFDHMLTLLGKHSLFNLQLRAQGDLDVDSHHTVEDVGIVLGDCLKQALGEKIGIRRYGWALLPMDETLVEVALDLSGRFYLAFEAPEFSQPIGTFDFQLVEEFLRGFAANAGMNLHVTVKSGRNAHHVAEAIFKGMAKALDQACQIDA
ncbi:MAG: imidazoleglycerol-phosphate dehydratase HisB, partial [Verrucomicrobia bacterium]|nr:imidazoleglycerol-phosphate dehydratase HisB [Verrucomicrobiota bacterium]